VLAFEACFYARIEATAVILGVAPRLELRCILILAKYC
jgi:hypothetical protein